MVMIGITPAAAVPVCICSGPGPFHELSFATELAAWRAIAEGIKLPLATLADGDRAFIDALLARTLARPEILAAVR